VHTRLTILVAATIGLASTALLGGAADTTAASTRGGFLTWEEAVALGHPVVRDFARPPGMPICPPVYPTPPGLAPGEEAPDDAPVCFTPPEEQGLRIPRSPLRSGLSLLHGEGSSTHRLVGSRTAYFNFEGGKMTTEVTNPSICSWCANNQHFYDRTVARSTGGNYIEMGWIESNWGPTYTGDDQMIASVTGTPDDFWPLVHDSWDLSVHSQYGFRTLQCGPAGDLKVCMQWYDPYYDIWRNLRTWTGVMRCESADGSGNCLVNFYGEAASADSSSWFDLNGGDDLLVTRDIKVEFNDSWSLFNDCCFTGYWRLDDSPYHACPIYTWYHFRSRRGTC
jgi:hypothetical protein